MIAIYVSATRERSARRTKRRRVLTPWSLCSSFVLCFRFKMKIYDRVLTTLSMSLGFVISVLWEKSFLPVSGRAELQGLNFLSSHFLWFRCPRISDAVDVPDPAFLGRDYFFRGRNVLRSRASLVAYGYRRTFRKVNRNYFLTVVKLHGRPSELFFFLSRLSSLWTAADLRLCFIDTWRIRALGLLLEVSYR